MGNQILFDLVLLSINIFNCVSIKRVNKPAYKLIVKYKYLFFYKYKQLNAYWRVHDNHPLKLKYNEDFQVKGCLNICSVLTNRCINSYNM